LFPGLSIFNIMVKALRVLSIEDSEDDALLVKRALEKGGYALEFERIETADAMRSALEAHWTLPFDSGSASSAGWPP